MPHNSELQDESSMLQQRWGLLRERRELVTAYRALKLEAISAGATDEDVLFYRDYWRASAAGDAALKSPTSSEAEADALLARREMNALEERLQAQLDAERDRERELRRILVRLKSETDALRCAVEKILVRHSPST